MQVPQVEEVPAPVLEPPPPQPPVEDPAPVEAPPPVEVPAPVEAPAPEPVAQPPPPAPVVMEESVPAEPEPVEKAAVQTEEVHELSAELTPDVENSSLEQVLKELCKEMKSATSTAVEGYDMSSDAVISHINIMQKVLESNLATRDENAWNQVPKQTYIFLCFFLI